MMIRISHQRSVRLPAVVLAALTALCISASSAWAASVSVDVSSTGVYVEIPFTLTITITNAQTYETPELPNMNGIEVAGAPSRGESTRISTINGRMTQRKDITLKYPLIVHEEGTYQIPPIEVFADGERFQSRPITINATSPEAGEELRGEIIADRSRIYLGQPLKLTLRLIIKPYADQEFQVRLSPSDMWSLIDLDSSRWSVFEGALQALVDRRRLSRSLPPVREITETTAAGERQNYYVYELAYTDWPRSTGTIDINPVRIVMSYPTRLQERSDLFRRGELTIAEWRPVLRVIDAPDVDVVPPPDEGRPTVFNGAVGDFAVDVQAAPLDVAVGEPITLTMRITDQSGGDVQLEMLQPPPLQRVDELTGQFRIPADPLTGVVRGNTKTFRQTIRAASADVTSIPSIPFAYFDPQREQYVVLRSEPIPINVTAVESIGAGDVEGAESNGPGETTLLTELQGGLVANKSGAAMLLADQRFSLRWFHALIVLLPPMLFAAVAAARIRTARLRADSGARRARHAGRVARQRLRDAAAASGRQQADAVVGALTGYVADRTNASAESMARDDVIARLHGWHTSEDVVQAVQQLLLTCDEMRYGSIGTNSANSIVERAQRCIDQLERSRAG